MVVLSVLFRDVVEDMLSFGIVQGIPDIMIREHEPTPISQVYSERLVYEDHNPSRALKSGNIHYS